MRSDFGRILHLIPRLGLLKAKQKKQASHA
jgi:hypothetical protein